MKTIVLILVLSSVCTISRAQSGGLGTGTPPVPPGMHPPHPGMQTTRSVKTYPDSVEFKKEFAELYPLIKPVPGVKERAETQFERMSRMFKSRGIDSAKAYDSVMKEIDPKKDEEILFDTYRADFSAEELKGLVTFFKTPVGKHYLEVEQHLIMARSEVDSYVGRTVQHIIGTMAKPVETPAGLPQGRPGMRPGMRPPVHTAPDNPPQPAPAPQPAPQGGSH